VGSLTPYVLGGYQTGALDAIELHDCFTITEYVALQHLGNPRVPINPSGGLIGGGHPVGATGVRMVLDAANMVRDGARRVGTLNTSGPWALGRTAGAST
jgi:acetyl-CoA C-acetyltransferase